MGMASRPLGRTGLQISPLTLGSMQFGEKVTEEEAGHLFEMAIDAGVNMVDTANVYGAGSVRRSSAG
jgi:1-deoxyxylulose-5-phosphate synthase